MLSFQIIKLIFCIKTFQGKFISTIFLIANVMPSLDLSSSQHSLRAVTVWISCSSSSFTIQLTRPRSQSCCSCRWLKNCFMECSKTKQRYNLQNGLLAQPTLPNKLIGVTQFTNLISGEGSWHNPPNLPSGGYFAQPTDLNFFFLFFFGGGGVTSTIYLT